MAEKFHFTASRIERIPTPSNGKPEYYQDEKDDELHLIVRPSGKKAFYSRIWLSKEKRSAWVLIGRFGAIGVEEARKRNLKNVAQASEGIDPLREKRAARSELTLSDLFETLDERLFKTLRSSTRETYHRVFKNHLSVWERRKLSSITPEDVTELRDRIRSAVAEKKGDESAGNYAANKAVRLLSLMFGHARKAELSLYRGPNPAADVRMLREEKLKRRLKGTEIERLMKSLDEESNETARDILKVLLFTGQRKGNVLAMRWKDVDLEDRTWTIPSRSSKNHESLEIPLPAEVMKILKRRAEANADPIWVFPSDKADGKPVNTVQKALSRVLKRADIKTRFRTHDFRHNFGSTMHDAGIDPISIKEALGHKDFQSTLRYTHAGTKRKREAIQAVADLITGAREAER